MENQTCETCKFWKRQATSTYTGFCRVHAPRPKQGYDPENTNSQEAFWPYTTEDDWCGEHQPKEQS